MSRPVKQMIAADLRKRYEGVDGACVVEISGMNVQTQEQLRRRLSKRSARVEVVKNSLARMAFRGTPLQPLGDALQGPCALVSSRESLIDTAKALIEAARDITALKLKQAIIEGDPNLVTVEELSRMKGRRELVGELAMLLVSPGRAIAGCLLSPQSKLAGCLKAMADQAA